MLFLTALVLATIPSTQPIVTAEKYLEYKKQNGHSVAAFTPPEVVLICYQQSTLDHLSERFEMRPSGVLTHLSLIHEGHIGILGGGGIGAPALATKMEQLTALGVKKFIAIGTAGSLMNQHAIGDFVIAPKALAEDGVAHLYLNGAPSVEASPAMLTDWEAFSQTHALPNFRSAPTWSFSAIFRETPADVIRVNKQGYDVVEMESATLYAIGQDKGAQTLSLFVISDAITPEKWDPHLRDPIVKEHLNQLADWAIQFCQEI
jgi:uridine phosphorylase